jgi:hypothetical protein
MIRRPKRALTYVERPVSCSEIDKATTFHIEHPEVRQSVVVISQPYKHKNGHRRHTLTTTELYKPEYRVPHTPLIMGYNLPLEFY